MSRSGPLVIYFLAYTSGYTPPFSRMSSVARLASLLLYGYNPWLSVSFSAYDSFPSLIWQRLLNGHQYLFSPLYGTWFNVFSSIPYSCVALPGLPHKSPTPALYLFPFSGCLGSHPLKMSKPLLACVEKRPLPDLDCGVLFIRNKIDCLFLFYQVEIKFYCVESLHDCVYLLLQPDPY